MKTPLETVINSFKLSFRWATECIFELGKYLLPRGTLPGFDFLEAFIYFSFYYGKF